MGFQVIDALGRLKQFNVPSEFTLTTTGNIDNLDFSNADSIRFNNASLSTLRGLKAGYAGQRVTIVSIGAGQVDLAHQNTGSTATTRLVNFATSASSSLAAGVGAANYQYDATTGRWRLVAHEQGAFITVAYNSGDFGSFGGGTWTVDAGDVANHSYKLVGRQLFTALTTATTSTSGASNLLTIPIPGGFTVALTTFNLLNYLGSGLAQSLGNYQMNTDGTIYMSKFDASNWANETDTLALRGSGNASVT